MCEAEPGHPAAAYRAGLLDWTGLGCVAVPLAAYFLAWFLWFELKGGVGERDGTLGSFVV